MYMQVHMLVVLIVLESPLLMENEGGVQEEVELLEQGKANF